MDKKKKRKPTAWNLFIKNNSHLKKFQKPNGSPDLTKMYEAFSGKSKSKSKPKTKSTSIRSVKTVTKKPEKKVRKTAVQKARDQLIPVSSLEKKTQRLFQRVEQIRLALGTSKGDCTINFGTKDVTIKCKPLKTVKRRKFSDAVKAIEKSAGSRI